MMPGLRSGLGIAVALLTSQAPEFSQQYAQRIGGAIDALRPIADAFTREAAAQGLSRDAAFARLRANPDPLARSVGAAQADAVLRYDRLVEARSALDAAVPYARPFVLAGHLDSELARGTLDDFRPAAPVTADGGLYAGLGFLLGFGGGHAAGRAVRRRGARPARG